MSPQSRVEFYTPVTAAFKTTGKTPPSKPFEQNTDTSFELGAEQTLRKLNSVWNASLKETKDGESEKLEVEGPDHVASICGDWPVARLNHLAHLSVISSA